MGETEPTSGAPEQAAVPKACPLPKVARRLGLATVVFFVVKGLITSGAIVLGVVKGLGWLWE